MLRSTSRGASTATSWSPERAAAGAYPMTRSEEPQPNGRLSNPTMRATLGATGGGRSLAGIVRACTAAWIHHTGRLRPARTVVVSTNRVHLTAGRDPYRDGNGGPRTQPGSPSSVESLDQARRRVVAATEKRLAALERDLTTGQHERVRRELPSTIAMVEQACQLTGHKQRQKRLADLVKRSKFATRPTPPIRQTFNGFTKRLRPRP